MNILVTGANGFIGRHLVGELLEEGHNVIAICRSACSFANTANQIVLPSLDESTNLIEYLKGVDCVMHLIGYAHVSNAEDPYHDLRFYRTNVALLNSIAWQSSIAGVKRFIYLSSVKVLGEETSLGNPFSELSKPSPSSAYGKSKLYAENCLRLVSSSTGMEFVIVRPPMVYGLGAKGNIRSLIKLVLLGAPLPFGGITKNQRSIVSIENLISFLSLCTIDARAGNEIFLVSDGISVSTADLVHKIGEATNVHARMFRIPNGVLGFFSLLLNRSSMFHRLVDSLEVDINKATNTLGWIPEHKQKLSLAKMASGLNTAAKATYQAAPHK